VGDTWAVINVFGEVMGGPPGDLAAITKWHPGLDPRCTKCCSSGAGKYPHNFLLDTFVMVSSYVAYEAWNIRRREVDAPMSRGKVLFIATVYTHLAAFHIPFMRLLRDKGYEVHVAGCSAEGRKEEVEATGVTCWEIPFARSPYSPANIEASRRLSMLLRGHYFDLIHCHTHVAGFLGRCIAKATGQGPVLYTAHGFYFYRGAPLKNWLIYYTAERLAVRWTDGLIVMNVEDFEHARCMGFVPGENLFLVHGVGVDLSRYTCEGGSGEAVRAGLGVGPDDPVVTCVAEFTPRKNHAFLLAAWSHVVEEVPKAHLLLVGDGPLNDVLRRKTARVKAKNVHFLGFRRDIPEILRATDVAVLVSKQEGLPRFIMEAMATQRPVIATDVRGSRDLVEHQVTGLLVKPQDVRGLTTALVRLLEDQQLRQRMGRAGRARIQNYSLDVVLEEIQAIYSRYLSFN